MANWKTVQHVGIAVICGAATLFGAWLCYATGNWIVLLLGLAGLLVNACIEGWLNRTYETLEKAIDDKLTALRADVDGSVSAVRAEQNQTREQVQAIRNSQIAQARPFSGQVR